VSPVFRCSASDLVPTNSKAQDFNISFGGVPGFYGPGYYGGGYVIPGTGIITTPDVLTIVPGIIRVSTTADTTGAIIGKTMIDR
jgi:hypothetical protein